MILWKGQLILRRSRNDLANANKTIKEQNEELTRFNHCLEQLVDERTVELQISNESLMKINNSTDNFIYKTSQDIREPLASLEGICNVALLDIKDSIALNYFKELHKTINKLQSIFKRLLVVNQINQLQYMKK